MIAPPRPPSHDELEALIKEARARQLRRRLLGAAGVAIAAALGLALYALLAGGAEGSGTAAGSRPRVVTAPCSLAAGWQLRLDGVWSEPTGQHTAPLAITRTGGSACTLAGYPKVTLISGKAKALGFRYSHRGDLVVAARSPQPVHITRGGSAYFLLNKYRCDVHETGIARWMRVTLPGVRGRLLLHLPRYPIIDYCPVTGPSTTIAVSPIVASLAQATARLP
jgi:uncharacterized protein DUF4232